MLFFPVGQDSINSTSLSCILSIMGCVASRIEKDERVQICKERKKIMKQLVGARGELADALLAYLKALKNTGVTLRQFTESESLELENTPYGLALPPSPPQPLPPSPPPPPSFSPDLRKYNESDRREEVHQKERREIEEDDSSIPSPPPILSSLNVFNSFGPSSLRGHKSEVTELVEDEKWAETKTEFEEEDQKEEPNVNIVASPVSDKPQPAEWTDDNSSTMSWYAKDTSDMAMVVCRNKKTLEGIMRELDDHFLKASACGKGIAVLVDINGGDTFLSQGLNENNGKYYLYSTI